MRHELGRIVVPHVNLIACVLWCLMYFDRVVGLGVADSDASLLTLEAALAGLFDFGL